MCLCALHTEMHNWLCAYSHSCATQLTGTEYAVAVYHSVVVSFAPFANAWLRKICTLLPLPLLLCWCAPFRRLVVCDLDFYRGEFLNNNKLCARKISWNNIVAGNACGIHHFINSKPKQFSCIHQFSSSYLCADRSCRHCYCWRRGRRSPKARLFLLFSLWFMKWRQKKTVWKLMNLNGNSYGRIMIIWTRLDGAQFHWLCSTVSSRVRLVIQRSANQVFQDETISRVDLFLSIFYQCCWISIFRCHLIRLRPSANLFFFHLFISNFMQDYCIDSAWMRSKWKKNFYMRIELLINRNMI